MSTVYWCFYLIFIHFLPLVVLHLEPSDHHYLVLLIPAEVVPGGKLLRPLDHKIDEVSATTKAADNHDVSQDSEEPPQVNVLILLVLLLVHDGLLFLSKQKQKGELNLSH